MDQDQETKKIPDFLKDLPAENIITEKMTAFSKFSFLKKIFVFVSVIWCSFIGLYLFCFFGWDNLSVLLPDEFVKFLVMAIVPLMLILLLVALVYRAYVFASQVAALDEKLGKIIYADNEDALSKLINQALQKQIKELNIAASHISQQNDVLKKELATKAQDFEDISVSIEQCFSQNISKLNDNMKNMLEEYKTASKIAENFSMQADELKNKAMMLSDELNPLINETISTADHLKSIIDDSKMFVESHSANIQNFAINNQGFLQKMMSSFDEKSARLEKTFLQTADNCEEIYKRLDGGISHIENSLKTHKQLAQTQSDLLDKNSTYLDNKLGEYGKLISMEVEAMVERSSTLDINIDKQLQSLSTAGEKISSILDGVNFSLEQKSLAVSKNIEHIVAKLESELLKLNGFITKTENKNEEIKDAAEKITAKIGDLSMDLGLKIDDLKIRAVEAIDKFNEVSAVVQKNTLQLSESANVIVNKGREGSKSLEQQHKSIVEALDKFDEIKNKIKEIEQGIVLTSNNAGNSFEQYHEQIKSFGTAINEQISELDNHKIRSERHLAELKQQYGAFSMSNFMNETSELITRLENLSVDINKFFNADEEDDLWKKFYSGDHAVFARNIVKKLNRKQIIKIRDEYEKNTDFRALTDKYISDFETLITAAQNAERSEVVLSMISGSDIGKIYYVVARAIDRLK